MIHKATYDLEGEVGNLKFLDISKIVSVGIIIILDSQRAKGICCSYKFTR